MSNPDFPFGSPSGSIPTELRDGTIEEFRRALEILAKEGNALQPTNWKWSYNYALEMASAKSPISAAAAHRPYTGTVAS
jgi:hypothetical protein